MAVTIEEMDVEVAPDQPSHAVAPPSPPLEQPDVRKTLTLLQERKRRLKAD